MSNGSLRIFFLALLTITLFPLVTLGCFLIFETNPLQTFIAIFETKSSYLLELGLGIVVGAASGIAAWKFISAKFMQSVLYKYGGVIKSLNLNLYTILFVSLCAGVGEEIFFRGALQSYLGIWITAILFIAVHGYLDPTNWKISLYGTLMTLIIALLGYMTTIYGLVSAMVAHTVIDIILFYKLTHYEVISIEVDLIDHFE